LNRRNRRAGIGYHHPAPFDRRLWLSGLTRPMPRPGGTHRPKPL